ASEKPNICRKNQASPPASEKPNICRRPELQSKAKEYDIPNNANFGYSEKTIILQFSQMPRHLQMLGFSEAGGNALVFLQMLGFSEAGGNALVFLQMLGFSEAGGNA
ncbi:MAG TPA: hypothetical protein PLO67_21505, partial [Saprospiraceae bacterium]|nr:hypothetical protein [Saprospiraceae bacterium]